MTLFNNIGGYSAFRNFRLTVGISSVKILENFNHHFNFSVSRSFYYSTDNMLLRKAFTDILNCCDVHFTYNFF